ncbi:MAG: MauE/DoxX family redox-associated membrane protein [bacterium]
MKQQLKKWVALFLRLGFGVLLIFSSFHKIMHPWDFSFDVENYRIVGEAVSQLAAVWLPYFELLLALFLISGIWLQAAVIMNFLLMQLFFILILQAFIRGLDINCGCFYSGEGSPIGPVKIIENIVFLGFSLMLLVIHKQLSSERTN